MSSRSATTPQICHTSDETSLRMDTTGAVVLLCGGNFAGDCVVSRHVSVSCIARCVGVLNRREDARGVYRFVFGV